MRGYKEINYRAMKLLPRGGYLATASCSHFATEELFIKMLRAAAKDAHRQLRQIESFVLLELHISKDFTNQRFSRQI